MGRMYEIRGIKAKTTKLRQTLNTEDSNQSNLAKL
jgi:hypothetical protein